MNKTTTPSRSQFAVLRQICNLIPSYLTPGLAERDASLADKVFWPALGHLQTLQPAFARGNRGKGVARRFRRVIHVVDSITRHRRRKPAFQ